MSVAIRRSLYGRLAGDTTLTSLLGDPPAGRSQNIHYQRATGGDYPMVIFSKQAGTPTYSFGGTAFDSEVWMVKGVDHSTDADPVETIAKRLDELLTDGVLSISGRTQMYLRRMSDIDYSELTDGETYLHAGALFRLVTEPS